MSANALVLAASRLNALNYDLAGGLREDSLNDFFEAHFESESRSADSVYKGGGKLPEIALEYAYDIKEQAHIDLAPIAPPKFAAIFASWSETVPELKRHGKAAFSLNSPANVAVTVNKIQLTVKAFPDGQPPIVVDLVLGIKVTAFVEVIDELGSHRLRITPIAARIVDQGSFLKQLDAALASTNKNLKLAATDKAASPDCTSLRRMIVHLVNVLLAGKISKFVQEFDLPIPIELFDNISIVAADVDIVNDLLVVLARVDRSPSALNKIAEASASRFEKEFDLDFHDIVQGKQREARERLRQLSKPPKEHSLPAAKASSYPNRGIFLIISQRFMQMVADAKLNYAKSEKKCDGWAIFKFCYDWFLRVWNPKASVHGNDQVRIAADFQGGGGAKVCIETHCGDICHRIGATARATPALKAYLLFKSDELWIDPIPEFFKVDWDVDGLPPPFKQFVEWILELLTYNAQLFVAAWLYFYQTKLTSLPTTFPGTQLEFDVDFDTKAVRLPGEDALVAMGEIDFKAK